MSARVSLVMLCVVFASGACAQPKPMEAGEMFSVLPEAVLTVDYETPDVRVSAHRFTEQGPFRVVVETRRDDALTHCAGDDGLQRALKPFESLSIQRRVPEGELAKLKKPRTYHRLRIVSAPPMEAYEAVLIALQNSHLLLENQGFAYELSLTTDAVDQLSHACRSPHARAAQVR